MKKELFVTADSCGVGISLSCEGTLQRAEQSVWKAEWLEWAEKNREIVETIGNIGCSGFCARYFIVADTGRKWYN